MVCVCVCRFVCVHVGGFYVLVAHVMIQCTLRYQGAWHTRSGHPEFENGKRADENHVTKTSSSAKGRSHTASSPSCHTHLANGYPLMAHAPFIKTIYSLHGQAELHCCPLQCSVRRERKGGGEERGRKRPHCSSTPLPEGSRTAVRSLLALQRSMVTYLTQ